MSKGVKVRPGTWPMTMWNAGMNPSGLNKAQRAAVIACMDKLVELGWDYTNTRDWQALMAEQHCYASEQARVVDARLKPA